MHPDIVHLHAGGVSPRVVSKLAVGAHVVVHYHSLEEEALTPRRLRRFFSYSYRARRVGFNGQPIALVLAVARRILGDRAVALTAHSPSVPQAEQVGS